MIENIQLDNDENYLLNMSIRTLTKKMDQLKKEFDEKTKIRDIL